jgi:hypothetical protein
MSIKISRYVSITSGVGAGATVQQRELIGRVFNDNPLIPVNAILEFTTDEDVGAYFGTLSAEYLRAVFYFGWVSKLITSPKKLSFGRYAKATAPARVYGGRLAAALADFQAVVAGSLTLVVGGQEADLVNIDLHLANSFAAVAATVQAAIRGAAGTQFAAATVTYDAVGQKFVFTSTLNAGAAISTPTGTLAGLLGWNAGDSVLSPGADVQTIVTALTASADISNNFGSFAFVPTLSTGEILAAAQWNDARNNEFAFCVRIPDAATGETVYAAVTGLSGVALTYAPVATEYDEMVPMMIEAATDYTRAGATQNYMYQQFALTPKVATDALADTLDAIRVNYYGVTQTAGQKIAFYQRGYLVGGANAAVDQNTYANECWLKDAAASAILTDFLALPEVPANARGRGMVIGSLQDPIKRALRNGVISVGKPLTQVQQLYITTITGDDKAWRQVQSIGYWLDCQIVQVTVNNAPEFEARYTLIYSKDDTIRKVSGSHVLI